jgi:tetratricopeptide (TPR) repeat protein
LRPGDVHGAYALGAACFAVQNYPRARRLLQPLTAVPATAAGAWYMLGRMDIDSDHDAQAESELRRALQANPRLADAAAHLGLVLLRQHRDADAAQALQQALGIDPDNYVANFQLLLLYRRAHDPRAAQQTTRLKELQKARISEQQEFYRVIRIDPGGGSADRHPPEGQGSDALGNHG